MDIHAVHIGRGVPSDLGHSNRRIWIASQWNVTQIFRILIKKLGRKLPRHMRLVKATTDEKVSVGRSGRVYLVHARMKNPLVLQLKLEALLVF